MNNSSLEPKEFQKPSFVAIAVFITLLLLPYANASLGTFRADTCVNIRILANCTSVDLIEVSNHQETFEINAPMQNLGGQTFNYTFCNTTEIDTYSYSWNNPCVDCSNGDCGNSFEITSTGQTLSTGKSVSYILIFIISLLIFAGLLILGTVLPSENRSDEMTGYIIAVNNLKYLKMFFIALAYMVAVFISYFSWMVSYSYLDMDFLTSIFKFIFYAQVVLIIPLLIVGSYIAIANLVRDTKINDYLSRGLSIK